VRSEVHQREIIAIKEILSEYLVKICQKKRYTFRSRSKREELQPVSEWGAEFLATLDGDQTPSDMDIRVQAQTADMPQNLSETRHWQSTMWRRSTFWQQWWHSNL